MAEACAPLCFVQGLRELLTVPLERDALEVAIERDGGSAEPSIGRIVEEQVGNLAVVAAMVTINDLVALGSLRPHSALSQCHRGASSRGTSSRSKAIERG